MIRTAGVLALGGLFLAAACTKVESPPLGGGRDVLADSADQVMFAAKFAITDKGLRRADIQSDTAYFFNQNTRIVLRPLEGTFFSSNGAKDGIIQAREGTYDTRSGVLEAHGDVLIITLDGKRLETVYAKFDQRLNVIMSDSAFFMSQPDKEIRGIGFTSDPDLTTFRVAKLLSAKAGIVSLPQ
ncbi:MAG: LPS export ABC transporter periplasmic protein LptC [Gemmatimonadetes bacterium]|nr:LPS export ABC transporter periplasmic protein LptC [Gemmatimonadota bacterium]